MACLACPSASAPGMSTCDGGCEPGYFANYSTCTECPIGTYGAGKNLAICSLCPPGTFGTMRGANRSASCQKCPAGTFSEADGASSASTCTACPNGTFSSTLGSAAASDCKACDPGTASDLAASACYTCPSGTFQNASRQRLCLPCPAGTFASEPGQTACAPCSPGTFSDSAGARSCTACPAGQLQFAYGGSTCTACNASLQQLPGALDAVAATISAEVCSPLSQTIALSWLVIEDPSLLGASGVIVNAADLPTWLRVEFVAAKLVMLTSTMIPPSAANSTGSIVAVRLALNQTCRSEPWTAELRLLLRRTDPVVIAVGDRNNMGVVEAKACPSFFTRKKILLSPPWPMLFFFLRRN